MSHGEEKKKPNRPAVNGHEGSGEKRNEGTASHCPVPVAAVGWCVSIHVRFWCWLKVTLARGVKVIERFRPDPERTRPAKAGVNDTDTGLGLWMTKQRMCNKNYNFIIFTASCIR